MLSFVSKRSVLLLLLLFLLLIPQSILAQEQPVQIEAEIDPDFNSGDSSKISSCVDFSGKFPLGVVSGLGEVSASSTPSSVELFGYTYELPFIGRIFHLIEPGIIAWYLVQVLIHL
jgi:hypothetical protein